jgi:hypothetical protein
MANAPKIIGTKIMYSFLKLKKYSKVINGDANPITSPPFYAREEAVLRNCTGNLLDIKDGIKAHAELAIIIQESM